jgi:hypothetical protein
LSLAAVARAVEAAPETTAELGHTPTRMVLKQQAALKTARVEQRWTATLLTARKPPPQAMLTPTVGAVVPGQL